MTRMTICAAVPCIRPDMHVWYRTIRTFGLEPNEIPEVVMCGLTLGNLVMRLWLYSMNNVGEFNRILNEKDGDVISNEVPIAFLCVELDSESANVSHSILIHVSVQGSP